MLDQFILRPMVPYNYTFDQVFREFDCFFSQIFALFEQFLAFLGKKVSFLRLQTSRTSPSYSFSTPWFQWEQGLYRVSLLEVYWEKNTLCRLPFVDKSENFPPISPYFISVMLSNGSQWQIDTNQISHEACITSATPK